MMLPDYAAITASFMAVGMSGNDEALYSRLLDHWDKGCFELHYELCQYATLSEQIIDAITRGDGGYDFVVDRGVYDYEVSEPFGEWFRIEILDDEDGNAPDFEAAKARLIDLACRFFALKDEVVYQQLCKMVCEELP